VAHWHHDVQGRFNESEACNHRKFIGIMSSYGPIMPCPVAAGHWHWPQLETQTDSESESPGSADRDSVSLPESLALQPVPGQPQ
jgi:hypothetical protein